MAHDRTDLIWTVNGQTTGYAYDEMDNLVAVTDADLNQTTMTYDALGRKIEMIDPDMGRWFYDYDPAGNLITQIDAGKQAIDFYYNARGQLKGKFYTSGVNDLDTHNRNASPAYDVAYYYDESGQGESLGRRTRMTDASGQTTWAYDVRGRVSSETKVIDGVSYTTGYTYNAMDQVTTMTYPDGEQVTQTYNNATQPESLTSNLGTYVSNAAYAGAGLLTQFTSGNNVTTNYTYNSLSQRLASLQVDDKMSLSYGYDRTGNVLRMDEQDTVTFADSFDTKNDSAWVYNTHQTVPYAGWDNNLVKNTGTETSWDANFYRSSYNLSSGEALQVRYKGTQTDNFGVVSIETSEGGTYRRFGVNISAGKIYVEYNDGSGWLRPKDLITDFKPLTWYVIRISLDDTTGFMIEVYDENDASTYASYTRPMSSGKNWRFHHWVYRGRVYLDNYLEWSDTQRGAFTYDALNRLTHAEVSGDGTGLYNRTYAYDPIGNLTNKTGVGAYSYNGTVPVSGCTANTPSTKPHAVDNAGSWSFGYDCAGNMTTRNVGAGQYTLTYNEENKLAEVKLSGATQATYTYDGDGTLVKKVVGGETTVYVGSHFEKNVTTGEVTKYYYLGGRRVAMRKDGILTYLHGDHLGSASMTTNALGGVGDEMRYYPYGETRHGSMSTDRRFTGQREETAIGLYDYKARYYDPVIGRFIQADTIVPEPRNPQALNRYAYVYGNPLRYTDPSGHIAENEVDDANSILEALRAYGVRVKVDWGWVLGIGGDETVWHPGLWTLSQLETVLGAVEDFARVAGSVEATRQAIGGAKFERIGRGQTAHWGFGRITLADHTFNQKKLRAVLGPRIAVVHELAHYWDWKTNNPWQKITSPSGDLARGLPTEDGPTAYGRSKLCEQWAESVAGYVYPEYFAILRAEGKRHENIDGFSQIGPWTMSFRLPGLGPQHYTYVQRQFRALEVSR